jgi:hypothetical protein
MDGRREFWRSLKTKDYPEALHREPVERDQWDRTFDDMRRRRDLTDAEIAAATWQHYSTGLDQHDAERLTSQPRPT